MLGIGFLPLVGAASFLYDLYNRERQRKDLARAQDEERRRAQTQQEMRDRAAQELMGQWNRPIDVYGATEGAMRDLAARGIGPTSGLFGQTMAQVAGGALESGLRQQQEYKLKAMQSLMGGGGGGYEPSRYVPDRGESMVSELAGLGSLLNSFKKPPIFNPAGDERGGAPRTVAPSSVGEDRDPYRLRLRYNWMGQ